MADNVNAKRSIEIHQSLHGYSDGHRQLAISKKLESADSKLLLTFSDISGPGAKPDSAGYLTGYPLSCSGLFALSRTWLALDMPRPGCVWTHTLLVRFADLAVIESLEELNGFFRCPGNRKEYEKYTGTLEFSADEQSTRPIRISDREGLILKKLYGYPTRRILIERPNAFPDDLVLALWSQQWPRLRRSFSFCSLSTRDRSSNGIKFDLQMFPAGFSGVARQTHDVLEATGHVAEQEDWLLMALRDLERPDDTGLRSFFKLVGSDVQGGREAFKPLCTLYSRLEEEYGGPSMFGRALVTLESEPSLSNALTARAAVANVVIKNIEQVDDAELLFLWKNVEYVHKELLSKHGTSVVRALWRRAPEGFDKVSWQNDTQRWLIDRLLGTIELSELLSYVIDLPDLEEFALSLRPEILLEVTFWKNAAELEKAVEAAAVSCNHRETVEAMMRARRRGLAKAAVLHFGERDVLSVISSMIGRNEDAAGLREWTVEATRDLTGITELLREAKGLNLAFLTMVAGCVSEGSVPNREGKDPWLIALRNAGGSDNECPLDLELAVFVLSRALGGASRSPGGLVQAAFERVDGAVANHSLPEELWHKLERHLPRSFFWFDLGRSHRIRTAVADLFVGRELPAEEFVQVTRVRTHYSHQMTAAARAIAAMKFVMLRSKRVAIRRQSLRRQNMRSMMLRCL